MTAQVQNDGKRSAMIKEAEQIKSWALYWYEAYLTDANRWRWINLLPVVGAALLAALSASTGLADLTSHTVASLLALGAAALSTITTALGAAARSSESRAATVANSRLADAAQEFPTTVGPIDRQLEVEPHFDRLSEQRSKTVEIAPTARPPWRRTPHQLPIMSGRLILGAPIPGALAGRLPFWEWLISIPGRVLTLVATIKTGLRLAQAQSRKDLTPFASWFARFRQAHPLDERESVM